MSTNITDLINKLSTSPTYNTGVIIPSPSIMNVNSTKQASFPIQLASGSSANVNRTNMTGSCESDSQMSNFIFTSAFSPPQFSNSNESESSFGIYHNNINKKNKINNTFTNGGSNTSYLTDYNKNKVSTFLPLEEIISNDQAVSANEIVSRIFAEVYSLEGNVDNLIRILSFHPEFLREFMSFYNFLMYSQHGALTFEMRHMLAIMASSRHGCIYLVEQQEREFLLQNGPKSWLHGADHIPPKLKDLQEINKLLCHQPWMINQNHIHKILKSSNGWTLTELIMAIAILTHFHALSGFVFGCGINDNYLQQLVAQQQQREQERRKRRVAREAAKNSKKRGNSDEDMSDENNEKEREDDSDCDGDDECEETVVAATAINKSLDKGGNFYEQDDQDESLMLTVSADARQSQANFRKIASNAQNPRLRSNSTGASNRTLSDSSASSCELGLDMLLKEMQMIKESDKNNNSLSSSNKNSSVVGKMNIAAASNLPNNQRFSLASPSSSPTVPSHLLSTSLSSNSNLQSYLNSKNLPHSQSGSNTITNSPIISSGHHYLSDLSNTKTYMANSNNSNYYDSIRQQFDNNIENSDTEDLVAEDDALFGCYKVKKSKNNSTQQKFSLCFSKSVPNRIISPVNVQAITTTSAAVASSATGTWNMTSLRATTNAYMLKYAYDADFSYSDFENADQSLKLEYYPWENQGYITAFSILPDICELIDKNFKIAVNMTYNTMGSFKDVDTSLFRRAVWHYIQSLFGVKYDDYDYSQIKCLLKSPLRKYIKIVCVCPESITKRHYDNIMREFTHSEKVHVNIVIMEARIQASMLYFLRAVNSYFG